MKTYYEVETAPKEVESSQQTQTLFQAMYIILDVVPICQRAVVVQIASEV